MKSFDQQPPNHDRVQQTLEELDPSHASSHGHDDHPIHPDERWLVSYADMMTLLFGLFVLLFSMASMDSKSAESVKKSAEEQFGPAAEEKVQPPPAPEIPDVSKLEKELEDKQIELEALREQLLAQTEKQNAELIQRQEDIEKLKTENEKLILEKAEFEKFADSAMSELKASQAKVAEAEIPDPKLAELENETSRLRSRVKELEASLVDRSRTIASVNDSTKEFQQTLKTKDNEIDELKKQLEKQKNETAVLAKDLAKETAKNATPKTGSGDSGHQSFLAFFINWPTKDHDIDLVIQDPAGKVFDFKKRKHAEHPGHFTLDTRRGPGVELWQSDRLIPGVYKATYLFYNNYGNAEAAAVVGTVFTPKGSTEIPLVNMTTDGKRKSEVQFEISPEGAVKIKSIK